MTQPKPYAPSVLQSWDKMTPTQRTAFLKVMYASVPALRDKAMK